MTKIITALRVSYMDRVIRGSSQLLSQGKVYEASCMLGTAVAALDEDAERDACERDLRAAVAQAKAARHE